MDNQHQGNAETTPGHRLLSAAEAAVIAEIKSLEARFNGVIDRVRGLDSYSERNVNAAMLDGEAAFMRLVRAVVRPARLTDS